MVGPREEGEGEGLLLMIVTLVVGEMLSSATSRSPIRGITNAWRPLPAPPTGDCGNSSSTGEPRGGVPRGPTESSNEPGLLPAGDEPILLQGVWMW